MLYTLLAIVVKAVNEDRNSYIDPIERVVNELEEITGFRIDKDFSYEDILKEMSQYDWN